MQSQTQVYFQKQFISDRFISTVDQDYHFEYTIQNVALRCDLQYHFRKQVQGIYVAGGASINFVTFESSLQPPYEENGFAAVGKFDSGETKTGFHAVFGGFLTRSIGMESQITIMNDFSQIGTYFLWIRYDRINH